MQKFSVACLMRLRQVLAVMAIIMEAMDTSIQDTDTVNMAMVTDTVKKNNCELR